MSEQKYPFGTVVQLKSGGPCMVVSAYDAPLGYRCVWFDPNQNKRHDWFTEAELMEDEGASMFTRTVSASVNAGAKNER